MSVHTMSTTVASGSRVADPAALDDSPRRAILIGGIVAALFFVGFLGWAALTRLDAAAHGEGRVIVAGNRQVIQHRYGGNIEQLLVKEGDHVRAGQILVRLSESEVMATERALAAAVIDLQAQRARLEAEVTGGPIRWPSAFAKASDQDRPLIEAAKQIQLAQATARRSVLTSGRSVFSEQQDQYGRQIQGFEAQAISIAQQRRSLQAQLESTSRLAERGDVSRNTVRALERSLAELDGNAADYAARAAALREQIAGTGEQKTQLARQSTNESAKLLRDTQFQLNDALPKWIAAKEQVERVVIRAPVTGRVVDLRAHSVGGVVAPGETVLDIVPDVASLEIRATFAPEDIDGVQSGVEAEVKFLSLHDRALPILMGRVRSVSADSVQNQRTGLYHFTADIVVPDDQIARLRSVRGANTGIRPGVPVQITVKLRRRTALEYMIEPLRDTMTYSMSER
ncbi:HlyD family type I secretion periplasmic adaptor subunit [Sphingomonas aliaeris]|uniref:Membrane fusion protein (MFP) family protein n=1 Tax=Sphingomonas aliaeris TaxID=2759526 RepID=A0A974NU59_9SPHN|nr:HlyD family type I secretion periplasmic adaptor subunit [Sphingomonas aliaeris]QQV76955.1 HlyD family type I secretion periplasmic adaptor subunit [Sphingomonas aliaeris]